MMSDSKRIKIGLIQLSSSSDIDENLKAAEKLIKDSVSDGAEMVVLPETFALMEKYNGQKLDFVEPPGQGKIQDWMKRVAKENQVALVGGTIAVESEIKERPYARCYVYAPDGSVITHYDKIHMFDVAVKDDEVYSESANTLAGYETKTFEFKDIKFGLSVCYDLRFPEVYRLYQKQNVEVILAPSAFTLQTGKVHWNLLLQARAVENLCFVVAPNQTGLHDNKRKTYGHSLFVGPWGDVLAEMDNQVGYINHEIDTQQINAIKKRFPVHTHRKL
ncbi:carbon-nitrogen hydrolase family protein [Kangiella sediminilitoris]|uniref:Nitrilase/cyanide hydratase and apolipoprotein N-acyltransferase n=1 Tax=Kangiella sediminilitoris TaxID=1144748 RepID=A0A1B3BCI2_9GAMM|nr:carbon-nitrogen hydrolase family protein [Kangiella sediminilitoris]AOE50512.1 Nitrilase/cyanide hydratase and apolipoprotein N-acyltransferase [Kangiella sediminilitoris]